MSLSDQEVRRIAWLARIALSDSEVAQVGRQLNDIFGLIEQMQRIDTEGVEPMTHPGELPLRLREDTVTEHDQRELFQAIAPNVEAGLYLVPKVIE